MCIPGQSLLWVMGYAVRTRHNSRLTRAFGDFFLKIAFSTMSVQPSNPIRPDLVCWMVSSYDGSTFQVTIPSYFGMVCSSSIRPFRRLLFARFKYNPPGVHLARPHCALKETRTQTRSVTSKLLSKHAAMVPNQQSTAAADARHCT